MRRGDQAEAKNEQRLPMLQWDLDRHNKRSTLRNVCFYLQNGQLFSEPHLSENNVHATQKWIFACIHITTFHQAGCDDLPSIESTYQLLGSIITESTLGKMLIATPHGWQQWTPTTHEYIMGVVKKMALTKKQLAQRRDELKLICEKDNVGGLVFYFSTHGDGYGNLLTSDRLIHSVRDIVSKFTQSNWPYSKCITDDPNNQETDFWGIFMFDNCRQLGKTVTQFSDLIEETEEKLEFEANLDLQLEQNDNSKHYPDRKHNATYENIKFFHFTGIGDTTVTLPEGGATAANTLAYAIKSLYWEKTNVYLNFDILCCLLGKGLDCLLDYKILNDSQIVDAQGGILKRYCVLFNRDYLEEYPEKKFENANPDNVSDDKYSLPNAVKSLREYNGARDICQGMMRVFIAQGYNNNTNISALWMAETLKKPTDRYELFEQLIKWKQLDEKYFEAKFEMLREWNRHSNSGDKKRLQIMEDGLDMTKEFFDSFGMDCTISVDHMQFLLKALS